MSVVDFNLLSVGSPRHRGMCVYELVSAAPCVQLCVARPPNVRHLDLYLQGSPTPYTCLPVTNNNGGEGKTSPDVNIADMIIKAPTAVETHERDSKSSSPADASLICFPFITKVTDDTCPA